MRRGLKEYLEQQQKDVAGVLIRFEEVFEEWATSEDAGIRYPSAAVLLADGTVTFDASDFSPRIFPEDQLPDGRYIIKTSEATTEFLIEIHTSSAGERGSIAMLMEESLNPVDFMYGFYLELPHYFGQWAHFQLLASEAIDDPTTIRHGLRPIKMRLVGNVSVVRPRGLPIAQPKFEADIQESGQAFTLPIGASVVSQGNLE
jgi:hypothetical protein